MTTLGTVILSDDLVLDGLENAPVAASSQRRTLGGESVVQVAPVTGGRNLALVGENHFTLDQLQQIRSLARTGQQVTLTHHRGTFNVLIVGIEAAPAVDVSDPDSGAWYSGTINMIEV